MSIENMNVFLIPLKGFESVAQKEVTEILGKDSSIANGVVHIQNITEQEIAKLTLQMRGIRRICISLGTATYDNKQTTLTMDDQAKEILQACVPQESTFAVAITKESDVTMNTPDIAAGLGGELFTYMETEKIPLQVKLKQPAITIHGYTTLEQITFGIDVSGVEMSKRPYKVVNTPSSLNGGFAYCVLRSAEYENHNVVVDPFCHDGVMIIEAALHSVKRSIFHYEHNFTGLRLPPLQEAFKAEIEKLTTNKDHENKLYGYANMLKTVKGAQKNAKIAGVHDCLTLSKVGIDWIDAKFDEGEVDLILTYPPQISKRSQNVREIEKIYDDLFYQAKYLLGKEGKLVLLMHEQNTISEEILTQHRFKIDSSYTAQNGGQVFCVYTLRKA